MELKFVDVSHFGLKPDNSNGQFKRGFACGYARIPSVNSVHIYRSEKCWQHTFT